jgi:hypothetical protein
MQGIKRLVSLNRLGGDQHIGAASLLYACPFSEIWLRQLQDGPPWLDH